MLFANAVGNRHTDIVEEELVEGHITPHVLDRGDGYAGGFRIEEEHGDPPVLWLIGIGAGENEEPVGVLGVGGPDLLAVDDVDIAFGHGLRLEGGEVGTGAGFAEALGPGHFAAEYLRQVLPALLFAAVSDERGPEKVDADAIDLGYAGTRHLFGKYVLFGNGEACAAVFLGPVWGNPTTFGQRARPGHGAFAAVRVAAAAVGDPVVAEDILWFEALVAVDIGAVVLWKTLADEGSHIIAKGAVFGGIRPVHRASLSPGMAAEGP